MAKFKLALFNNLHSQWRQFYAAQSEALTLKWQALEAREQVMLRSLSWFLPAALLVFVLSESWQGYNQAKQKLQAEQKLSSNIGAVYSKLSGIQDSDLTLSALVEQQSSMAALALTQVPIAGKGLQITVKHNDFAVLANLMVNLEKQGVTFNQYQISQDTDKSIVLQAIISKGN